MWIFHFVSFLFQDLANDWVSLLSQDFRYVAFVGNGFHGFRFQTWNIATKNVQTEKRSEPNFIVPSMSIQVSHCEFFCRYCLKKFKRNDWIGVCVCVTIAGKTKSCPTLPIIMVQWKIGVSPIVLAFHYFHSYMFCFQDYRGHFGGDQIWCKIYVEGFPLWSCSVWVGVIYNDPWIMGRS